MKPTCRFWLRRPLRPRSTHGAGAGGGSLFAWIRGGLAASALATAAGPGFAQAAAFRLSIEGMDGGRHPNLVLSTPQPGRYGIEASADLVNWFSIHAGTTPADGVLRFRHDGSDPYPSLFYRGVRLPDTTDPDVVPVLDPLAAAATVITPDEGGSMTVTASDGTIFSFTVGPGNVIEPVAVGMRLVADFTVFPAANRKRSAVVFEPDGFEFAGAGQLEIRYPAPVESLEISSFAFDGDGTGFHLVPDTILPDRVLIPVTHFSGTGAAFWESNARATAIAKAVSDARDGMAHEIAGTLGRERMQLLLGQEPNPEVLQQLLDRMQEYHDRHLVPFFAEARTNCALAKFLMREILGLERQRQLLGLVEQGPGFLGASGDFKAWNCNCQAEVIQACEEGTISDRTLLRELLGYERQAQLLGVAGGALEECGLGSLTEFWRRFQDGTLPCVPEWAGHLTYTHGGSRTWDCAGGTPDSTCVATSREGLSFTAEVETAEITEELSFPPFYTMTKWKLTFHPEAQGSFTHDSVSTQRTQCGSTITTTSTTVGSGSGPMTLELELTFENGELTGFELVNPEALEIAITQNTRTVATPCEGSEEGGFTHSGAFQGSVFVDSWTGGDPGQVAFVAKTPTEVEGSATGRRTGLDSTDLSFSLRFSLKRRMGRN